MPGIQGRPFRVILLAASGSSGAEGKKYTEARDIVAEKLTPVKLPKVGQLDQPDNCCPSDDERYSVGRSFPKAESVYP